MRRRRKRHPITLLEIMIVILLIGLIGGVLSYNLKGTLDRGKVFRTEEGIKRLKEILEIEIERGSFTMSQLAGRDNLGNVRKCLAESGFIAEKDVDGFLLDGWKEPYIFVESDTGLEIYSAHLHAKE